VRPLWGSLVRCGGSAASPEPHILGGRGGPSWAPTTSGGGAP